MSPPGEVVLHGVTIAIVQPPQKLAEMRANQFPRIAVEHPIGGRIRGLDNTIGIDRDDAVDNGIKNGIYFPGVVLGAAALRYEFCLGPGQFLGKGH